MTDDKQGSGFSWFVAGLGLGALLGVLYAPKAAAKSAKMWLTALAMGPSI